MPKWILLLAALLLLPRTGFAQQPARSQDGTMDAAGEDVVLNVRGMGSATIQLTGTFVGTVAFQVTNNRADANSWTSITCELPAAGSVGVVVTTTTGYWHCPIGGVRWLRTYMGAYTSGAAAAYLETSIASRALPTPQLIAQIAALAVNATIANSPSVSVTNFGSNILPGQSLGFSMTTAGFTPAATATDLCVISGSATSTIKVTDARLTGTATAARIIDVFLIKRSTANTGGTFVAGTVVPHDSNDTSVAPTVGHYTANPTTGTLVGTYRASKIMLPIAGTVVGDLDMNLIPPGSVIELRGTASQLAINYGGAALVGGEANWRCHFTWFEE